VHRATVSAWPGTTLNLLKFPLIKPSGWSKHLRALRMNSWKEEQENEQKLRDFQLRSTGNPNFAVLIGRVGRSYLDSEKQNVTEFVNDMAADIFQINPRSVELPKLTKEGLWDPKHPDFAAGRWCYDTPGTVNENQILDQFRLEELMDLIPKTQIRPRTFYVKLNQSLFVGGICRIDYSQGRKPIRLTVFAANTVPVTITETEDADEVFQNSFGTPIMGIPRGNEERLSEFPPLLPREFEVRGESHKYSCADIVISATGWVAITAGQGAFCNLVVHSPGGKGMYLRQPALLPYAINTKGKRIRDTSAYLPHHLYIPPALTPP